MVCGNCGKKDDNNSQFCMKCGQPLKSSAPPGGMSTGQMPPKGAFWAQGMQPKRKRGLAISILISVVLLTVLILVLILSANPVAGRWYAQNGKELVLLKNGKGMTVMDEPGAAHRVHFIYAVGYREPGYIEGEIYEKVNGGGTWFYVYDGALELNGEYFYRQKPATVNR